MQSLQLLASKQSLIFCYTTWFQARSLLQMWPVRAMASRTLSIGLSYQA